jgi:hypothetical protein
MAALLAARAVASPASSLRALAARHPALGGLALFGAVAAACRPASFRTPIGRDTGAYLYVGDVILHGGTPYVDAANNKGPLTYVLFAAIDAVGGTSVVFVRLVLLAFAAVAALALAGYFEVFAGRAAAVLAGVTLAALQSAEAFQGDDPNSEQFALAPMAVAWWLATRPQRWAAVAAGACVAAAVAMNPALVVLAPFVAWELWRSRREGRAGRFASAAGGAVAVIGPLVLWLGLAGALPAMWEQLGTQSTGVLSATQPHPGGGALFGAGGQLADVAAGVPRLAGILGRAFAHRDLHHLTDVPAPGLWLAGIVGCLVALRDPRLRRIALPALGWIVFSWLRVKLTRYEYPHHYAPALVGIAAGIAAGTAALWRPGALNRGALSALVLAAPVWAFVLDPQWQGLAIPPQDRSAPGNQYGHVYPVSHWLRDNTPANARIYVVGAQAEVYWLADRRASTPYFDEFAVIYRPAAAARRSRDLHAHPPDYVVATFQDVPSPELQSIMDRLHYRLVYTDPVGGRAWTRPG